MRMQSAYYWLSKKNQIFTFSISLSENRLRDILDRATDTVGVAHRVRTYIECDRITTSAPTESADQAAWAGVVSVQHGCCYPVAL